MIKRTLLFFALAIAFGFGFAFNSILTKSSQKQEKMKRVTGIGGIFFKSNDPAKIRDWYKNHLGLDVQPWGTKFDWREESDSTKKGYTVWAPFPEKTRNFEPSTKDFMINYRVENIKTLVETLKTEGVTVLDTIETYEYGKFVHILDIEGNKLELFEPAHK